MHHNRLRAIIVIALLVLIASQLVHIYAYDLRYIASEIDIGAYWRLLSGHFIHIHWWHLIVNMAGLIIFLILFGDLDNPLLLVASMLMVALITSLSLYYFYPYITWYAGFSAVLHGLFVVAAIRQLGLLGWTTLLIISIKVGWEVTVGPIAGTGPNLGLPTITEANLSATAAGFVTGWIARMLK